MSTSDLLVVSAKSRPDKISPDLYCDSSGTNDVRNRFILEEHRIGDQYLQIVDKTSPHSLLDLMITIKTFGNPVLSFNELNPHAHAILISQLGAFYRHITDKETVATFGLNDSVMRISANIAKITEDRYSIQGERTLHVHMSCFPGTYADFEKVDLDSSKNASVKFGVIDPFSRIGSEALLAYLQYIGFTILSLVDISTKIPFGENELTNSLFLKFSSWDVLDNPDFAHNIRALEKHIEDFYNQVLDLFYDSEIPEKHGYWKRRKLLPAEVRKHNITTSKLIPENLKTDFEILSDSLKAISESELEELRIQREHDKSVGNPEYLLPYAGPTYTYTFFHEGTVGDIMKEHASNCPMYLEINPLLRRTAGAGGLYFNANGNYIKVNKNGAGTFTAQEMSIRHDFQQAYLSKLSVQPKPVPSVDNTIHTENLVPQLLE